MLPTRRAILAPPILCSLLLPALSLTANGQTAPANTKLALNATLVLTPEFCATKKKQGDKFWTGVETLETGKAACAEMEPALRDAFASLTRVETPPSADKAGQVVLFPKFVDASATRPTPITIFNRPTKEMVVELEWTAKDPAGKTVWIETIQGSDEHRMGMMENRKKIVQEMTDAAVRDAIVKSAAKMAAAPELQKLAGPPPALTGPVPPAAAAVLSAVTIGSDVAGADIEVDGAFSGNTPSTLRLPVGRHVIKVSRGSLVWQRNVEVLAGSGQNLNAVLNPAPQ